MGSSPELQARTRSPIVENPVGAVVSGDRLKQVGRPDRADRLIGLLGVVSHLCQIAVEGGRSYLVAQNSFDSTPVYPGAIQS